MNEWKEYKFSNIAYLKKNTYLPAKGEKVPYIGLEHINEQSLTINSIGSSEDVNSNKFIFEPDDVLFGKLRPYFRKVYNPKFKGICSTDIWVLKTKKGFSKAFLFYFVANPVFIKKLTNATTGTKMPRADWSFASNTKWLIPSFEEQQQISNILSSLDNKIDLLRRQNETIEVIAQTLFKRWFVEFEFPDENGQPYKSSGGKMVSSELGEMPEGWSEKCFYELGAYINGGAFKQEDFSQHNAGLPIIKIVELKYGITNQTKYTEKQVSDKIIINDKDILFSWSGSPETSINIFVWNLGRGVLNQHTFKVIPNKSIERTWLYNLLKLYKPLFIRIAKQKQTTGLGHVTVSDLRENKVVFPNNKILTKYNLIADPIFKKYYLNLKEINTLSKLRDILLPKLMSGQIRIKEK